MDVLEYLQGKIDSFDSELVWINETMISEGNNMKIRELLEVLNTDSVVLARENDMLVDCETPYINQELGQYVRGIVDMQSEIYGEGISQQSMK